MCDRLTKRWANVGPSSKMQVQFYIILILNYSMNSFRIEGLCTLFSGPPIFPTARLDKPSLAVEKMGSPRKQNTSALWASVVDGGRTYWASIGSTCCVCWAVKGDLSSLIIMVWIIMSLYGVIGYRVTLSEGHMIANHPI